MRPQRVLGGSMVFQRAMSIVPGSKSRNIPEVILVRRGAVGVLGMWGGGGGVG